MFSAPFLIMLLLNNEQPVLLEIPGNIKLGALRLIKNPADKKPVIQGNTISRNAQKAKGMFGFNGNCKTSLLLNIISN